MSYIFLYGPPGSGKTTLAASMADLGLTVRFIDVDDKVRRMENMRKYIESGKIHVTPIKAKLTQDNMREAIMRSRAKVGILKQPSGYLEICDIITEYEKMVASGNNPPENVLVIDSLTSMVEHMKRLISHVQGKTQFTFDEWAIVLSNLEEFFYICKGLLKQDDGTPGFDHIIITAHEMTERDEITGKIQTLPFVEGQMRHKVGKYFEEMYYCSVELPKGGMPVYKVLTVSTERYTARSSRDIPPWINSDFATIFGQKGVKR